MNTPRQVPRLRATFCVYHKDGWYTTISFCICKRNYTSSSTMTRSFDKWHLEKSQIKNCRFDRIGRPLKKPACQSHKDSQNAMIYSYRNSQVLVKAALCSLFLGTCLLWMLTHFAIRMDFVALANNAGHNWFFLKRPWPR